MSRPSGLLEIIEFWRTISLSKPPFIHSEDLPAMQQYSPDLLTLPTANFRQFLASQRFGDFSDHRFHFSLLPIPYLGDLNRADIFLLQLNPGLNLINYYAEWNVPAFRRRVERSVRQELDGVEFPFYSLDPELCWYSGYRWWEGKLRDVATIIAHKKYNGNYFNALRELSQRIAVIELVPYHSIAFHQHGLIRALPSTRQAISHLNTVLIKKASSGKAVVIAARKVAAWGLRGTELKGVVPYPSALSRGSSLSSRTPGGKAILKRFGIRL